MKYDIKLKSFGDNENLTFPISPKLRDAFSYGSVNIITNEDGFMVRKGFAPKPRSLFLLGDSFAECALIEDGKRIHDVIEKIFKTSRPMYPFTTRPNPAQVFCQCIICL